jgi:hypothetical protein
MLEATAELVVQSVELALSGCVAELKAGYFSGDHPKSAAMPIAPRVFCTDSVIDHHCPDLQEE